jgi:hypothetical protein
MISVSLARIHSRVGVELGIRKVEMLLEEP